MFYSVQSMRTGCMKIIGRTGFERMEDKHGQNKIKGLFKMPV